MKTIRTKFLGPTNHRGPRYRADDGDGNVIVISADHGLSASDNHVRAFQALCGRMQWSGKWAQGHHKNEGVFVRVAGLNEVLDHPALIETRYPKKAIIPPATE